MSSSTAISALLPAPLIKEAMDDPIAGLKVITLEDLTGATATLEIPSSAVKAGDRVRAWSSGDSGTVIDEIKTVAAIPLTFSVAKEKLIEGHTITFSYLLLNDKDEPTAVSSAVPYSIV